MNAAVSTNSICSTPLTPGAGLGVGPTIPEISRATFASIGASWRRFVRWFIKHVFVDPLSFPNVSIKTLAIGGGMGADQYACDESGTVQGADGLASSIRWLKDA